MQGESPAHSSTRGNFDQHGICLIVIYVISGSTKYQVHDNPGRRYPSDVGYRSSSIETPHQRVMFRSKGDTEWCTHFKTTPRQAQKRGLISITGGHSTYDQLLVVKIGKYIGFCVYRRSYLLCSPVIVWSHLLPLKKWSHTTSKLVFS